ncbi:MAG: hypothetical protein ACJLS2_04460 [Microcella pacifica]
MQKTRRNGVLIAALSALVVGMSGTTATAETIPSFEAAESFGIFAIDGGTLEGTWTQMVEQIGPKAAEGFIREAAQKEVNGVATGVPGLTEEGAKSIAAAAADEQFMAIVEPPMVAMAVPAFPIVGSVVAGTDRRTWRMNAVATYSECILGFISCTVTDRRTTTITIEPGGTGNRVQYQQSYFPSTGKIGSPSYTVRVYRNGFLNGTRTTTVGINWTSINVSNQTNLRSNGFAFTVTGSAVINGSLINLPSARTADGACTSASSPICRFG